ncbi:MAG: tetratricopeptide repeat protein [Ignavibacteria bacterium]|nr:tetratricopeptide repeat protein [Ignavibacteria bacterium]
MKKTLIIYFILSVSIAAQSIMEQYSKAMEAYTRKDYVSAHNYFKPFLEKYELRDELYSSAIFHSSEALLFLGEYNAASSGFEFLINNHSFSNFRQKSLYRLGLIYFERKEYELCRSRLQKLIDEYPNNEFYGSALYWIGESFTHEEKLDDAVDFFLEAVSNRTNNKFIDYTIYSLANVYEKLGDYTSAVTYYDELLSYFKDSPLASAAQIRIGLCYFKLKEYDSSILELRSPLITNLDNDKQAETLYLLANSYYRVGEYDNAAKTYLEIVSKFPNIPIVRDARYALAWSYFQQKKYADANKIFNTLTDKDDSLAVKAFYWKSESLRYLGNENEALRSYEDFIKRYPNNILTYAVQYQIGVLYYNSKKYELALNLLENACNSPDEVIQSKAYTLRGEIQLQQKKYQQAVELFKMIETLPNTELELELRGLLGLGISYYFLNRFDDAIFLLTNLDQKHSQFESDKVNFYLAESYFAKGKFQEALASYQRINSLDNPIFESQVLFGKAYTFYNMRDYTNASFQFTDFLRKFPNDSKISDVRGKLADSYFADKNFTAAVKAYEDILKTKGNLSNRDQISFQYALALFRSGKSDAAIDELLRLRTNYAKSPFAENAHYLVGWIYFKKGNFYEAINNYRILVESTSNQKLIPLALYAIGDSYFNIGNYDSAIVNYQRILDYYPKSSNIFDALNGIQYSYVARGETEKAISLIDSYVMKNPQSVFSDQLFLKKGETFYSLRNYEKAKNSYKEFIAYFPKSKYIADAYYWVGKSARNLGAFEEAIFNFKTVFNTYTSNEIVPAAVIEMGNIYNSQKRYAETISLYDQALTRLKGTNRVPELMFMKAETYSLKGDFSSAYDLYDEIAIYYGTNVFGEKSKLELGLIELKNKRYDKAVKNFQVIIGKKTDDIGAKAQYYLGVALQEQNKTRDAITAYVRVLNLFSAYDEWVARSYIRLGECYQKLGDKNKAREMFRTVINKRGNDEFAREARTKLAGVK